jgi:hypothetical protein
MDYHAKPKDMWHLLFGEVSSCHIDHIFLVQLNQTIEQLPFGWCGKNFQLIVNEVIADGSPKEFEVTIAVEAPGKGACRTVK